MYSIILSAYEEFLDNSHINIFEQENKFWLTIDSDVCIVREGFYYKSDLTTWREFNKDYINILCSCVKNSKDCNLRLFLNKIYTSLDKNIEMVTMTEEQAYKILVECKQELENISKELAFCSKIKYHRDKIDKLMTYS